MTKSEFLSVTDLETGEPIYLDVQSITGINQLCEDDENPRRTTIRVGEWVYLVREEARLIALATGRGFLGPKDF
jgi:hypothetical protein